MQIGIQMSNLKVNAFITLHTCKFGWAQRKKMKLVCMCIWRKRGLASSKSQTKQNSEDLLNLNHLSDSGLSNFSFFYSCGAVSQLYPTTTHPIIAICLAKLFCMAFLCEVNNTN